MWPWVGKGRTFAKVVTITITPPISLVLLADFFGDCLGGVFLVGLFNGWD
jgi:hypothetical protein